MKRIYSVQQKTTIHIKNDYHFFSKDLKTLAWAHIRTLAGILSMVGI